eukprot:TRINITY_DN66381_c7_g5_i1.p1 TRINITY_DN66381_c7_g5~~TRINITY_DN66381_c7_g5_i1.p1  ORF type:complete len:358 (-),score=48.46 TRINITY_DN66381_c7_g5_i1:1153-2226(-)
MRLLLLCVVLLCMAEVSAIRQRGVTAPGKTMMAHRGPTTAQAKKSSDDAGGHHHRGAYSVKKSKNGWSLHRVNTNSKDVEVPEADLEFRRMKGMTDRDREEGLVVARVSKDGKVRPSRLLSRKGPAPPKKGFMFALTWKAKSGDITFIQLNDDKQRKIDFSGKVIFPKHIQNVGQDELGALLSREGIISVVPSAVFSATGWDMKKALEVETIYVPFVLQVMKQRERAQDRTSAAADKGRDAGKHISSRDSVQSLRGPQRAGTTSRVNPSDANSFARKGVTRHNTVPKPTTRTTKSPATAGMGTSAHAAKPTSPALSKLSSRTSTSSRTTKAVPLPSKSSHHDKKNKEKNHNKRNHHH